MLSQQQTGDIPIGLYVTAIIALESAGVDTINLSHAALLEITRLLNQHGHPEIAAEVALNLEVSCGDSSS